MYEWCVENTEYITKRCRVYKNDILIHTERSGLFIIVYYQTLMHEI